MSVEKFFELYDAKLVVVFHHQPESSLQIIKTLHANSFPDQA